MRGGVGFLALAAFLSGMPGQAREAAPPGSLLFHASLNQSLTAEFAAGDREPLAVSGVRLADSSAQFPVGAKLTYDARGNLLAEQGTASFWWRTDQAPGSLPFAIFQVSYEQHSTWGFNFMRVEWTGTQLAARIRDRNQEYHTVRAQPAVPPAGRWMHIAVVWSERSGLVLYVVGRRAAEAAGPLQLDGRLDQFGFLAPHVSPHMTSGTENPGAIDEIRVYGVPLDDAGVARLSARQEPAVLKPDPPDLHARYGWSASANVPVASALRVKRIAIRDARDIRKFWWKGVDGKRETVRALVGEGYADEGKVYRVYPAAEPINLLRTTGNLAGSVSISSGVSYRRSPSELHYHRLKSPAAIESITIAREAGVLGDLECLLVEDLSEHPPRLDPPPSPAVGAQVQLQLPVKTETPADAVRLRLRSVPGAYYYAAVQDPVNEARKLIEADVQAAGDRLDLTLDFPDLVVPAGKQITIVLASSHAPLQAEAEILTADPAKARTSHIAERSLQIRDSFQMLSEERPWMYLGRSVSVSDLRRRMKLVDELYTLLEDVRRVDPQQPVANAYWGWINRLEPPPALQESARPRPGVPLWAHRQLLLLRQFRQVVDWWIDNRQIENGEMGGDLNDDTDLVQNWPAVALLDGPAGKIGRSVRAVLDACYAQKRLVGGLNARRTDGLHAYEEGINAQAPAFLLDYGNPVLFERMMETAAQYTRLTGINSAGHRHLRSNRYSAGELVEEGYQAREDTYSHLILHPGLYLAWYNGCPPARKLLREVADSLLAHWQTERYPSFAKQIFFADDRVGRRDSPSPETFNLFWGLYDIERDEKYAWLLREAVKHADFGRAGLVSGPWLNMFDTKELAGPLMEEVRKRNIDDHNLQTDQAGLVARDLAWQAGGGLRLLEDAHRALLRHMSQNMYLYTEAEQFADRIWIPTLSVQRERLGGVAHYRNHIYPGHSVSWENTGGDVAALVLETRPTLLRVLAFNAGMQLRRATLRVWRLENGRYEVTVRKEAGEILSTRSLALKRHSPVEIDLPPEESVVVEFRQTQRGIPLDQLPDLAVAAEELRDNQGLEVPVHNIGAVESRPFVVTVRDQNGKVLAESRHGALAAPLDLKPSVAVIRFPAVHLRPGLRIKVTQEANAEEICDENNQAVATPGSGSKTKAQRHSATFRAHLCAFLASCL